MPRQTQVFENNTSKTLDVYIEAYPDHYRLQPKDIMQIEFDYESEADGLHTVIHDDSLQIYLHHFDTTVVTINGLVTTPLNRASPVYGAILPLTLYPANSGTKRK